VVRRSSQAHKTMALDACPYRSFLPLSTAKFGLLLRRPGSLACAAVGKATAAKSSRAHFAIHCKARLAAKCAFVQRLEPGATSP
jgi:hypothetical protein